MGASAAAGKASRCCQGQGQRDDEQGGLSMSDLQELVNRANRARLLVKELTAQRAALVCEHERAYWIMSSVSWPKHHPIYDLADGTSIDDKANAHLFKPCWKGEWGDPGEGYIQVGDDRGWCEPCRKREKLRQPLMDARAKFGALRAALWRKARP